MQVIIICIALIAAQILRFIYQAWVRKNARDRFIASQPCQTTGPSYPHIPGLLGLDFMFRNFLNIQRHRFAKGVRELFQTYGTTHSARLLHRRMINTIDPENLQAVMKTNFDDYTIIPGREKLMRVLFGVGVFGTEGSEWRHSRALVRTGMVNLQLDRDVFETHFEALVNQIHLCRSHSQDAVDFGKTAFNYTFNVATETIIGGSVRDSHWGAKSEENDIDQFGRDFTMLGKMARVLTIMISQIPYLTNIMYWNEYRPTQRRVFNYLNTRIHKAHGTMALEKQLPKSPTHDYPDEEAQQQNLNLNLNRNRKHSTLLEGLAAQSTDVDRVRSELLHLLLAGHDTVGIALSEMFYCLARKPLVWAKLRTEVEDAFHGELPTLSELKRLTYLQYTINEAIRVRPTLSVHGRVAVRDTVIPRGGGPDGLQPLYAAKGTYIVYSNYALYRNPDVFGPDVDDFRPERWGEGGVNPARYEYLNFGAGPRACPGKELGWTMLAYVTVRLAQTVKELAPVDDRPWEEAKAFSFHNRHGVHIAMKL